MSEETKNIMVVEDDEKIGFLLDFILTREGFQVIQFFDGKEASQYISQENNPPELVLLDIMLPFKDGFQLLKEIKSSQSWKNTTVLMLTAKAQSQEITRALDQGASDYIIKPFQPEELIARIKRFLPH
ncbi:MAG: response regulator transcription factor [Deltaproteobacteria bacterium]|nr:response regulator transcription factor [Deltaproteobacteria bacterium]